MYIPLSPLTDAGLEELWTGCFASQLDGISLLASPAINGYHSIAEYSWERNGIPIAGENTPLLYCCNTGVFKCLVSALGQTVHSEFIVSG